MHNTIFTIVYIIVCNIHIVYPINKYSTIHMCVKCMRSIDMASQIKQPAGGGMAYETLPEAPIQLQHLLTMITVEGLYLSPALQLIQTIGCIVQVRALNTLCRCTPLCNANGEAHR